MALTFECSVCLCVPVRARTNVPCKDWSCQPPKTYTWELRKDEYGKGTKYSETRNILKSVHRSECNKLYKGY